MDKIVVIGGKKLEGVVEISGSKNATLPIMAACLLTGEKCVIKNVPEIRDVFTMIRVLNTLGAKIYIAGNELTIDPSNIVCYEAPYELVKTMRASFLVLGPLLARFGKSRVSLPGGCAIGPRPVDIHLKGFKALGAEIEMGHGDIKASCSGRLKGNKVVLDYPSVGATENIMMAATLAQGKTVIENAACEPEIIDLAKFLISMGAKIEGSGTNTITISGSRRRSLKGATHKMIADRIEAGTFMIGAAITDGNVLIKNCDYSHHIALISKLEEAGVKVKQEKDGIRITKAGDFKPVKIKTMPYPGFPTDIQAQFMVLLSITSGQSVVTETVFENRFIHVAEINRMGANIRIEGDNALIEGVPFLTGAHVMASDLRASAALIIAGLVAHGETHIHRVYHLDRGYEKIESKLSGLGAMINRISGDTIQ
ncbi:MAG: UDP-N-acetylglucosamine 1-carboxyvinyltransferase [Candidatus Firestonebacteria bacterium]|nr:UDP-N-acetylglucosamine 1-carboxyvinyltransferase [Candidatus Firestonebacteria bacterium]